MLRRLGVLGVAVAVLSSVAHPVGAVHFYRGPGSGCTPAAGELGQPEPADVGAEVLMLHNTFNDRTNGGPVTVIDAGQSVRWTWNSEHCHSVTGEAFDSGFHYPAPEPTTPALAPGLLHYPVPEMDDPKLAYTMSFPEPGTYTYACVHHAAIGMNGVVVVR